MDHSWRLGPPPSIQGNVCPSCSINHFPFCPPPHPISFNQNPRFQSHNSHSFQRPFEEPFIDHPRPIVNLHRPFVGNPGDRFGSPPPWHRNPSLEYEQSQIGDSGRVNGGYGDGFAPSRYDHGDAGFKRMRVDEMGTGSFVNETRINSSRISMDDERRLKLIRDHGGASVGTPLYGANSVSGMVVNVNRETIGYLQENSVFDRTFGSIDSVERGRLDELRGGRNDMTLKPLTKPTSYEMNDFWVPGFSDFDRKGRSFRPEPDFDPHNDGEEHGLAFGQQKFQSYRNEELGQSLYGQGENSLHLSLQTNGRNGVLAGRSTNVQQGRQGQDVANLYHGGGVRNNLNLGDSYSQSASYCTSEVPCENDYHQSFQYPSDSLSAKEPHYSHPTGWHGLSASSAPRHEQRSSFPMENHDPSHHLPRPYAMQNSMQLNHDICSHDQLNDRRQSYEVKGLSHDGNQAPVRHQSVPTASRFGSQHFNKPGSYVPLPSGNSITSENMTPMQASRVLNVQPPLPASPPPPLPLDPPRYPLSEPHAFSSPAKTSSSLFPIPVSSATTVPSSYAPIPEAHSLARPYFHDTSHLRASTGFAAEEFQITNQRGEGQQPFPLISSDKPKVVDGSHILKQPLRATRPGHIVIILRGLPGSGKSYLAKMLRDLEVDNGGNAPRIHSMDDYFMTEVEKVEKSDPSGSVRGKKPVMKKVMEYCYEPEMEEAYRSSMLKAFKKTLDEGVFSFVIVDDRNLRVADFAQFWATAKRSGYEVYLLEATYKDPAGCAARNVHGFTQDDIEKMAGQWEEAPSLYLRLDIKSLFQGDDLKESGIQEVDMDTEDGDSAGTLPGGEETNSEIPVLPVREYSPDGSSKCDNKWDAEGDHLREEVKELGRSKWSDDLDYDNANRTEATKGNLNALSGLIKAYTKEGKSVHWGDQVSKTGFSIGAARKLIMSLVIGPGAGYNLKSNPLPEEHDSTRNSGESKRQSVFQERIRAERESFRAVFDKRRQRIGGLCLDEE